MLRGAVVDFEGSIALHKKQVSGVIAPDCIEKKVDFDNVHRGELEVWLEERVASELGFEDDILVGTIMNELMDKCKSADFDPRTLQSIIAGFLQADAAATFIEALWEYLLHQKAIIEAKRRNTSYEASRHGPSERYQRRGRSRSLDRNRRSGSRERRRRGRRNRSNDSNSSDSRSGRGRNERRLLERRSDEERTKRKHRNY